MEHKQLSVVIGSYNRYRFLKLAIASVREELERSSLSAEIIVVDGGSTDGALEWLVKQKDIITIVQHNRGEWGGQKIERRSWGYFMNLGFKAAQGKYICMLSDDCLLVPGAIGNGVALFDARQGAGERVGAVAFYWRNWPEETAYRIGFTYDNRLHINHGLFSKKALADIGFADECSYQFYHADSDLSMKLWEAHYICIISPNSFVEHRSHVNTAVIASNQVNQQNDWKNYVERWGHLPTPDFDWHYINYFDIYKTAKKFKYASIIENIKILLNDMSAVVSNIFFRSDKHIKLACSDHPVISLLKSKFNHGEREFIHGIQRIIVDCLYCHAVPGTLELSLLKLVEIKENYNKRTVLNVGGGTGQISNLLKELGFDVVNLDIAIQSPDHNNINFDLNSFDILNINGKKFDIVFCQEVIEHVENPWQLFRHINNVINANGYLVITTPNIQSKFSKKLFNSINRFHWFTDDCTTYHINPIHIWEISLIAKKFNYQILNISGNSDYYFGANSNKTIDESECLIFTMKVAG